MLWSTGDAQIRRAQPNALQYVVAGGWESSKDQDLHGYYGTPGARPGAADLELPTSKQTPTAHNTCISLI